MHILGRIWDNLARLGFFWRLSIKSLILIGTTVGVLFPNPVLLIKQLLVYRHTESLIQTDFDGLERINQELDALVPAHATQEQEFQAVQRYVYDHIPYAYDWDNWLNADYWPTAAEVWERKQEDCDGRAVLATSILRSRGFTSARLSGNIRHIWVTVGADALMGPEPEQTIRREGGKRRIVLPSPELLLGSLAISVADFPTIRNLLLLFTVLLLCYHPCRYRAGFLGLATMALVGFIFLKDWAGYVVKTYNTTINVDFWMGGLLLSGAIVLSCCMQTIVKRET